MMRFIILLALAATSLWASSTYLEQIKSHFGLGVGVQPAEPSNQEPKKRLNTVTGQHVEAVGAINVLSSSGF